MRRFGLNHFGRLAGRRCLTLVAAAVAVATPLAVWADGAVKKSFPALAVQNVKIVERPGKVIERGTIVIRDGLIAEVGAKVEAPYDALIIDGEGLTAVAGFIDAATGLGLPDGDKNDRKSGSGDDVEIDFARGALARTRGVNRNGIFPDYSAARHVEAGGKKTEQWRAGGFTAVHTTPTDALLAGSSALVALTDPSDTESRQTLIAADFAMIGGWRASGRSYPTSLMGSIAHLRQTFLDAQHYELSRKIYEKHSAANRRPPYDAALEALQPVLSGAMPIVFPASSRDEIDRAIDFAEEFDLNLMIEGAQFGFKTIDRLKKTKTPILLRIDLPDKPKRGAKAVERLKALAARMGRDVPKDLEAQAKKADKEPKIPEPKRAFDDRVRRWEERAANAKALWEAEIPFAISTKGNKDPEEFHKHLRQVIEAGLPADAALHALTLGAAELFGIEKLLGEVRKGRIANLTLIEGDFGEEDTSVKIVIVDGIKYEIEEKEDEKKDSSIEIADKGDEEVSDADEETSKDEEVSSEDDEAAEAETEIADWAVETDEDRKPKTITGGNLLIRDATVLTVTQGTFENTSILVTNGIIKAIGPGLQAPRGHTVIDGNGAWVMPGIIDCHSHMAISGGVNEGTQSITAQVRIEDVIRGDDLTIYRAAAGGVTTANLLHGSANTIGGQRAIIQMRYNAPTEELLFEDYPRGIKFALGENVTRRQTRFPNTRMGVEAVIRRAFNEAQRYQREWAKYEALGPIRKGRTIPPRRDLRLETLAGVLDGSIWVHCHSYNADEIAMVLDVLEEFGVTHLTLEHALEAYKVAPEAVAFAGRGAFVSTFADNWAYKMEAYDAIPYNVALIAEAGGKAILNSDSGERVRHLYQDAAKMVRYGGLSYDEALKTITYHPALALGIADRVGSIEVGKQADLALFNGHPLNGYARCFMTTIGGEVVFERPGPRDGPYPLAKKLQTASGPAGENERGLYAIVNATIHPVSSPAIEDGTIVFQNGRITSVGQGTTAPAGATVVDAGGMHVYPGLIDAGSTLGLNEIGSLSVTRDAAEGGLIQPDLRAGVAVKPDSELIPVARFTGITSAIAHPTGGLIPGQSAMIQLDGWTPKELAYADGLALEITLPRVGAGFDARSLFRDEHSDDEAAPTPEEQIDRIKELFAEAREYGRIKAEAARRGEPFELYEPDLEALVPYAAKEKPVIIRAGGAADILAAIELANELDVKAILRGCAEGWKVARKIAESGLPVILGPVMVSPTDAYDPYDAPYANAARLHEAGVKFCFQSSSGSDSRNLPFQAAMAVAHGLPRSVAIAALTTETAKIFGLADRVGSLEVGKRADIIVVDRDPLQPTANVRFMFINGKPVDVDDNRHTRLYNKYRRRLRGAGELVK